jgi:hypothetical protein
MRATSLRGALCAAIGAALVPIAFGGCEIPDRVIIGREEAPIGGGRRRRAAFLARRLRAVLRRPAFARRL